MTEFQGARALLNRLAHADREVVFVVGSALTMSARGVSGVPGVWHMTERVVAAVRERLGPVEAATLKRRIDAAGGRAYQVAFEFLNANCGPEASNAVIRGAVLEAHASPPDVRTAAALGALEEKPEGWHLPPAVKALGWILAHGGEYFRAPVLTTNFDPLIEVAIRAAGGEARGVSQLDDAALSKGWGTARDVIHIHGHWLDDTWHAPDDLKRDRPLLKRSLAWLFEGRIVVVLAYGGWEDMIMASLAAVVADAGAKSQLLWGFYADEPGESSITQALGPLGPRATFYAGIDVHDALLRLRAKINGEHEQIGRTRLCNDLLGALDGTAPVEIVGEPFMKRSRLLVWLEQQARLMGRRVVRVNAGRLAHNTPAALLEAIAEKDGREEEMRRALTRASAVPDDRAAAKALPLLDGLLILVDDADKLAAEGNGFSGHFFDELRARIQDPACALQWVSVSQQPLVSLFRGQGWTSSFLSDAVQHVAGALDRGEARRALAARFGEAVAARGLALAGTIPRLVYEVCESEFGDGAAVLDRLADWGRPMLERWWSDRSAEEHGVLRMACKGVPEEELNEVQRSLSLELQGRGLLLEMDDSFAMNGSLWETHVQAQE